MKSKKAPPKEAPPKEDRKTVSFKVSPEDYDRLKLAAAGDGLAFSTWCRTQLGARAVKRRKAQKCISCKVMKAIIRRAWAWVCIVIGLAVGALAACVRVAVGVIVAFFLIGGMISLVSSLGG